MNSKNEMNTFKRRLRDNRRNMRETVGENIVQSTGSLEAWL